MATRAQQFDVLMAPILFEGSLLSTPYAKFLAAGTSSTLNAYADKDKSVAITKKALSNQGTEVYGDGIYDIEIYAGDPDAGGVLKYTINDYKCVAVIGNTRTVTDFTVTGSVDDSLVLFDTTSGNITYTLPDATLVGGKSINLKKIIATNTVTIDTIDGQTVDGLSSISIASLNSSAVCQSNGTNWFSITNGIFRGRFNGVTADTIFLPNGWSVAKNGTGDYTLTHNLGSATYTIIPSHTGSGHFYINVNSGINSVSITTFADGIGAADVNVSFILIQD